MGSVSSSELCSLCRKIGSLYGSTHHNYEALQQSAMSGCPLCTLIYTELGAIPKQIALTKLSRDSNPKPRSSEVIPDRPKSGIVYKVFDCGGPDMNRVICLQLFREGNIFDQPATGDHIYLRNITVGPSSLFLDKCLRIISTWAAMCLRTHPECRGSESQLPSYVLDLSQDQPVLVKGQGRSAKYTILSHCWGKEQPPLLTELATVFDRCRCISMDSLPESFRDAVTVTKKLGIRYLWIDSLCIIQDSEQEWRKEAAQMKNYYRNAYLTISALEASDSHCGFLCERAESTHIRLSSEDNLFVRKPPRAQNDVFKEAILNTRAWTLQERLLSTRIVHFSKDEIFWECLTCSARESSTIQYTHRIDPSDVISSEGEDFKRTISLLRTLEQDSYDSQERTHLALATWYRLVTQYTMRSLTVPTDKLPAISGIASEIQSIVNFTYLAGIWKEDPVGLLWAPDCPAVTLVGPLDAPLVAPSWSWASSPSTISRHLITIAAGRILSTYHLPADAKILTYDTSHDASNQLIEGSLVLQARMMELEYHSPGCQGAHKYIDEDYPTSSGYSRLSPQKRADADNARIELREDQNKSFGCGSLDTLEPKYLANCGTVCSPKKCMVVFIKEVLYYPLWPKSWDSGRKSLYLLAAEVEVQKGKWRRIGVGLRASFGEDDSSNGKWTEMKKITLI